MYPTHSCSSGRHDTARAVRARRRSLALNIAATCAFSIAFGLAIGWLLAQLAGLFDGAP